MAKSYTISDGDLVLSLEPLDGGQFLVRSPMDPELVTQADSIADAFESARDAMEALNDARQDLYEKVLAADAG